jgi:hypothetical protein
MARILNLPVKIRNGEKFGGARVVGWLPVVRPKQLVHDFWDLPYWYTGQ